MQLSSGGKRGRLRSIVNHSGVIAAVAMDQRGSLRQPIAAARGLLPQEIPDEALMEFKSAVSRILTPHASAILLDPDYGLPAAAVRAPDTGLLLCYEADTFVNPHPHKIPQYLSGVTVRRLVEWGAAAVKVLVRYDPFLDPALNAEKRAFVERAGVECMAHGIPYLVEFTGYGTGETTIDYARRKPEIVRRSIAEFSQPQYCADVLKVEIPINAAFLGEGYSRAEALGHFRALADAAAGKPIVFLSAGVSHEVFTESLRLAAESGLAFHGVLCGRATWQGGILPYARHGLTALEDWLAEEGVRNVRTINELLSAATPVPA